MFPKQFLTKICNKQLLFNLYFLDCDSRFQAFERVQSVRLVDNLHDPHLMIGMI